MSEKTLVDARRSERKTLCYYLKVIDLKTGKELGRVGDITGEGMMLLCKNPLDPAKSYSIRVILDKNLFDRESGNLDIDVRVRWSRPDVNPSIILTGLIFLHLDNHTKDIVRKLVDKIGMSRRLDISEDEIENGIYEEEDEF